MKTVFQDEWSLITESHRTGCPVHRNRKQSLFNCGLKAFCLCKIMDMTDLHRYYKMRVGRESEEGGNGARRGCERME